MEIIENIASMHALSERKRMEGKLIGFVPTMGFLHEGHLSLIREAKKLSDMVIVSIFVNPTQFRPNEDYDKYPRDLEGDTKKVNSAGGDIIFAPPARDMYPDGYLTYVNVEGITETLCGISRPGHFRGVTTVVTKLFNIVKPHKAFFGQKDYQQSVIIKKMVRDLNMDIDIILLPTVREHDGLAMSSRNSFLSTEERKVAPVLYRALIMASEMVKNGEKNTRKIYSEMKRMIENESLVVIDYISITDPETLTDISEIKGKTLIALAVKIGSTRLIDNLLIEPYGL
ncbi:MAG: pantoate--beta-alanine ligase [Nitrospirae bacterium]|nr:pantoate--beta-alanine ligase [Nitrospirota bacterium]